jgi:hypothetical protein
MQYNSLLILLLIIISIIFVIFYSNMTAYTNSNIIEGLESDCTFNATRYSDHYSDLKKAFGYDESSLKTHYKNRGMAEGRTPCGNVNPTCKFDPTRYGSFYSDLQNAFKGNTKSLTTHYKNHGINEGRLVCGATAADKAADKAAADKAAADKAAADKAAADKAAADKAAADKAAADKAAADKAAADKASAGKAAADKAAADKAAQAIVALPPPTGSLASTASPSNAVTTMPQQSPVSSLEIAVAQQQQQLEDALQEKKTIVNPTYSIPISEAFGLYY